MLKINKEVTRLPNSTYVNGWFNGKEFAFTYHSDSGEFQFGTRPCFSGIPFECVPLSEAEQKELSSVWLRQKSNTVLTVPYVSVWDGGVEVITTAHIDIRTGEVTNIAVADISGLDICERQYVVMNDEQVDVYADEHGYEFWADIGGEYGSLSDGSAVTTQCVNGILKSGDLVISTPFDDYVCLIGLVGDIYPVGTPEHDAETENETDDVHVDFMVYEYSDKRKDEIAEMFSELYNAPKEFDDCPIDDAIMSPDCLIRITGIDSGLLNSLLSSGYNAACYCYRELANLTAPKEQPDYDNQSGSNSTTHEQATDSDKTKEKIFNVIDTAVTLAGFKVLDGDRDSVIIRHCESDTDFEIKVGELPG